MAFNLVSSTPKTKRAQIPSDSCPLCERLLGDGTESLCCSICELVFCISCTNISHALPTVLKDEDSDNFKWTCNNCKRTFRSMSNISERIKSIEEKTENR